MPSGRTTSSVDYVVGLAVGFTVFGLGFVAFHQFGAIVAATVGQRDDFAGVFAAVAFIFLCTLTAFVTRRFGRGRRAFVMAGIVVAAAASYAVHLMDQEVFVRDGVFRSTPGINVVPASRWLPAAVYDINDHGFRGRSWSITPTPGISRVAVVGDSFVYGQGVAEADTLSSLLQHELRRRAQGRAVEVLNFGIPGNAITGHIAVAKLAAERHGATVVVVALTLPNDLNRWGTQQQLVDATRPSLFSVLAWLTGPYTATLVRMALAAPTRAMGRAQAARQLRRAVGQLNAMGDVASLLYVYHGVDRWLSSAMANAAVTLVDDCVPKGLAAAFPVDGHPTPIGNLHHARRLAPLVARALGWSRSEGAAAPSLSGACGGRMPTSYGPWQIGDLIVQDLQIVRLNAHDGQLTIELRSPTGALTFDLQAVKQVAHRSRHQLGGLQLAYRRTDLSDESVDAAAAALFVDVQRSVGLDPTAATLVTWLLSK